MEYDAFWDEKVTKTILNILKLTNLNLFSITYNY